jgi:hypothetical protein
VTKELAVANGVFFIIMWIPYLDLIFFIPYVIVHFLLMMQLKEVALCIIRYKAQSTQQTNAPESVAKTLLA